MVPFVLQGERDDLLAALAPAERFTSKHGSNLAEQHVRVRRSQERDECFAEATDGRMSYRSHLWGTFDAEEVDVLVHPRLARAVAAMQGGPVTVTRGVSQDGSPSGELEVTGKGKARYAVPLGAGTLPTTFPGIDNIRWDDVVAIDAKEALAAMVEASGFANRNPSNPATTGVNLGKHDGALLVAATDSYRFFQDEVALPSAGFPFGEDSVILPLAMVEELARLFPTGEVRLAATPNLFFAKDVNDETTFASRRLDGKFPDMWRLVPPEEDFKVRVKFPRAEARDALNRIRRAVDGKTVRVELEDADVGFHVRGDNGEAEEHLFLTTPVEKFSIGFNLEQLISVLDAFSSDEVEVALVTPLRPALVRTDGEARKILLMSVRIQ